MAICLDSSDNMVTSFQWAFSLYEFNRGEAHSNFFHNVEVELSIRCLKKQRGEKEVAAGSRKQQEDSPSAAEHMFPPQTHPPVSSHGSVGFEKPSCSSSTADQTDSACCATFSPVVEA